MLDQEAIALMMLTSRPMAACTQCAHMGPAGDHTATRRRLIRCPSCRSVMRSFLPQHAVDTTNPPKIYELNGHIAVAPTPEVALAAIAIRPVEEALVGKGTLAVVTGRRNDEEAQKQYKAALSRIKCVSYSTLLDCPCTRPGLPGIRIAFGNRIETLSHYLPGLRTVDSWPRCVLCYAPLCMEDEIATQDGDIVGGYCHPCARWSPIAHDLFIPQ